MSKVNNNSSGSGFIGFIGLLTLTFAILKVIGFVSWSWFWVFTPVFFLIALVCLFMILGSIFKSYVEKENKRRAKPGSKWEQKLKEIRDRRM